MLVTKNCRSRNCEVKVRLLIFLLRLTDYVCVSCYHLMYRQTVVRLNRDKYKKTSDTLLELVLGD